MVLAFFHRRVVEVQVKEVFVFFVVGELQIVGVICPKILEFIVDGNVGKVGLPPPCFT